MNQTEKEPQPELWVEKNAGYDLLNRQQYLQHNLPKQSR